jgi:hypothetical protein
LIFFRLDDIKNSLLKETKWPTYIFRLQLKKHWNTSTCKDI